MQSSFSITNKTRGTLPKVSFVRIKNAVMGKDYCLSLVFIGENKSKSLNKIHRGKNKPTNILSFPLDKKNGEVFMTPSLARKEAKLFGRKYDNFMAFLFIHGLLHLKGMKHSSRMEKTEKKLRKKFGV